MLVFALVSSKLVMKDRVEKAQRISLSNAREAAEIYNLTANSPNVDPRAISALKEYVERRPSIPGYILIERLQGSAGEVSKGAFQMAVERIGESNDALAIHTYLSLDSDLGKEMISPTRAEEIRFELNSRLSWPDRLYLSVFH